MRRYGLNQPRGSHFFTKVMMCICGQSIVAINEGHKREGFKQAGEFQFLKYQEKYNRPHRLFVSHKPTKKCEFIGILKGMSRHLGDGCGESLQRNRFIRWNYQILAILLVNGNHPTLCSAVFVGLFDADVGDIREITQGL